MTLFNRDPVGLSYTAGLDAIGDGSDEPRWRTPMSVDPRVSWHAAQRLALGIDQSDFPAPAVAATGRQSTKIMPGEPESGPPWPSPLRRGIRIIRLSRAFAAAPQAPTRRCSP